MEKNKTLEKAPTRLGRGLSALIPPSAALPSPSPLTPPELGAGGASSLPREGVSEVALADIRTNPNQPRTVFNQAAIDELAASIKAHGVLQPVMVRPRGGGGYELVAGERRFRAAEQAGLKRIPAVVRSLTDEESLTVALIENIQREDLNPIEAARTYKQLMEDYGLTQTQLGEQIGKQQSTISNAMRLLTLPVEIQNSISEGLLTEAHGRTLLSLEDKTKLADVWQETVTLKLSVEKAKELVDEANFLFPAKPRKPKARKQAASLDAHWKQLAEQIQYALSMKATIKPGKSGGGTLLIEFADADSIEAVLERLHQTR